MSLARLALRLATVEGLRPTASLTSNGPWPTIAQKYVLDSRVDPLNDVSPLEARPIVCVYTEHDEGTPGQKRGGPPFLATIDLTFELSVVVKVAKDGDPSQFVVACPETDDELEASLDLFEAQIKFALLCGPTGEIWRSICHRRIHSPRSVPHRTSEESVRLARRTMTWRVEVNEDQFDAAPSVAPTGIAIFPEPLKRLAEQLPALGYAMKLLNGLAGEPTAPVMPTAVPLETVAMAVAIANPAGVQPAQAQIAAEVDNLES
jgi:hypothetical protein